MFDRKPADAAKQGAIHRLLGRLPGLGLAKLGLAKLGLAKLGLAKLGPVRLGIARGGTLAALALLAGCAVIPKSAPPPPPPPPPPTSSLPADGGRHRVALLVPMAGPDAGAGQAIANAATMALLDTNAQNLRISTYDTSIGAGNAAARAVADGNALILGPLLGEDAPAVAQAARAAHVPVLSFSNDIGVAGEGVFVMGNIPGQAIARVVRYARANGARRFAALIPLGTYGERAASAFLAAVQNSGGTVVGVESYDRALASSPGGASPAPGANLSVLGAARRLRARGPIDAVLIADTARIAAEAAPVFARASTPARLLGTELWSGEALVARSPALSGALFASLADDRYRGFADSYKARFGAAPYRIATLGYDGVLLALRIARDWQPGTPFPTAKLYDRGGFIGVDGVFRFNADAVIERALEVRGVHIGGVSVLSPAPTQFGP